MKKYYLIKTKPQQEAIATQNLSNQGFDVFFPKAVIKNKTTPLFPGYLFIELDDKKQNWTPVRSTKGVANFVRFGLNFATVSNQIINMIKIQQQQTIEALKHWSTFVHIKKVIILKSKRVHSKASRPSFKTTIATIE